jgi:hypothetical protein
MTHIDFTDPYAAIPGVDDGIGAWVPLSEEQRHGWSCIDCTGQTGLQMIGRCDEGRITVCSFCYVRRLRDHIDYYRPQS